MNRITPLEPPYPRFFEEAMAAVMPPGTEPLTLFKAVATSPRAWDKFTSGSLFDKGPLSLREREIVIDRTAARCGCDYEWGVHIALFAGRAGLSEAQVADTAAGEPDAKLWSEAELVLLESVDALLDRKRLDDADFARLRSHFDDGQILEIVQLVAFYHGVSLLCGMLALDPEPGMPRLPHTGD